MKLSIKVDVSKKTNRSYCCLVADLGYRKAFLNFDTNVLAELLQAPVADLITRKYGEFIAVADGDEIIFKEV